MRLWCHIVGHKPKRPRKSLGESGLYTTCKRCDTFFIRGYFNGWQRATASEKAYYLRMYGPDAPARHDVKDDLVEEDIADENDSQTETEVDEPYAETVYRLPKAS